MNIYTQDIFVSNISVHCKIINKKLVPLLCFMLIMFNISFAENIDSITKHHYFKFQARIKIGAGTSFKSMPNSLGVHNVKVFAVESVDIVPRDNDKQDFLKSKRGPYTGANFDFYFHKNITNLCFSFLTRILYI